MGSVETEVSTGPQRQCHSIIHSFYKYRPSTCGARVQQSVIQKDSCSDGAECLWERQTGEGRDKQAKRKWWSYIQAQGPGLLVVLGPGSLRTAVRAVWEGKPAQGEGQREQSRGRVAGQHLGVAGRGVAAQKSSPQRNPQLSDYRGEGEEESGSSS
jgi:hypothetical protein